MITTAMTILSKLQEFGILTEKLLSILFPFAILIIVLVFVHELGHYFFARINGVAVTDFAVGFGPKICSFKDKRNTTWSLRAIPFGGYVKMLGDENVASFNGSNSTQTLQSEDINSKHPFRKFLIAIGGPLFNFIFAFIIFFGINYKQGALKIEPIITDIQKNSLAEKLKFKINDRIISINGFIVKDFYEIKKELALSKKAQIVIERQEKKQTKRMQIEANLEEGGVLGILSNKISHRNLSIGENINNSAYKIYDVCNTTIRGLKKIITRELSSSNISGPIGIAKQSENFFNQGFLSFAMFLALISVNLGMVNLFPIPLLDGGVAIVCLVEGIIGRELPELIKKGLMYSGYAILILLTILSFSNDIIKLLSK